jgi:hypothetical protein
VGWFEDRWYDVAHAGAGMWLAIALWAAVILGIAALIYTHRQLKKTRELRLNETRPHIAMFMEPHPSDWHLIELVVRNYGKTAAYDVQFIFVNPPTVGQYESEFDGMVGVAEVALPATIPVIAPGQEWRTVWDSALSRAQLGGSIESRFVGTAKYYNRPAPEDKKPDRQLREFQSKIVLDWQDLQPVQRVEVMTGHDLAKRERQKLELLRQLLTYFHHASQETRAEAYQTEIEGLRRATEAVKERQRARQLEEHPTDVQLRSLNTNGQISFEQEAADAIGKHRGVGV